MHQYTEPMQAHVRTPKMKRPEKAERSRSKYAKQAAMNRRSNRARKASVQGR